jgi:hypothetical protein
MKEVAVIWFVSITVGLSVLAAEVVHLTAFRPATPAEAVPLAPPPGRRGLT